MLPNVVSLAVPVKTKEEFMPELTEEDDFLFLKEDLDLISSLHNDEDDEKEGGLLSSCEILWNMIRSLQSGPLAGKRKAGRPLVIQPSVGWPSVTELPKAGRPTVGWPTFGWLVSRLRQAVL